MEQIKFGTDGWRDVIARGFTFGQVRRAARGLAHWLRSEKKISSRQVLIGYDTRFLSPAFAQEAAWVLASEGFEPVLSNSVIPTPCLSWNVWNQQVACGVMITSSHNTGDYNGFKVKLQQGCSAFQEQTQAIEKAANAASDEPVRLKDKLPVQDLLGPYLGALKRKVDWGLISKARLKIVADSMHGAAGRILADHFSSKHLKWVPFRSQPDPLFGGIQPEPVGDNLLGLQKEVLLQKAAAGLAHDGDADRVGLVDERGQVVNAHQFLALLVDHLVSRKKGLGDVVRTFSGTQLVDRLCKAYGITLHETPIGFKHIAKIMMGKKVLVGGEESNGFGFGFNLPERDGLLGGLVLLEILAAARKPLSNLLEELRRKHGAFFYERLDLAVPNVAPEHLRAFLEAWHPQHLAGLKVLGRADLDGSKFFLEGGAWLLMRPSGTEPLMRLYCEAMSRRDVLSLLKAGQAALEPFL